MAAAAFAAEGRYTIREMKGAKLLTIAVIFQCILFGCTKDIQDVATVQGYPAQLPAQNLTFRHKVSVEFPKQSTPLVFDGLLQLGGERQKPVLRAVGLGVMGLTMFDITIAGDTLTVSTMQPSLRRIPDFHRHTALCLASVYGELLGIPAMTEKNTLPGHGEVRFSEDRPWPEQVEFRHYDPDYAVKLKFVGLQTNGTEITH
jgi:hypothetical protein